MKNECESFPLMLELCPSKRLRNLVRRAQKQLTPLEQLSLGNRLAVAVGLRAEALAVEDRCGEKMDLHELDHLLTPEDGPVLAEIVRPYLS